MSTVQVMFHLAPAELRDRIVAEGLRTGMTGGFSQAAGEWAPTAYGVNPVYLSLEPGRSADTRYSFDGKDLWQVDVSGLDLVCDLPGLYDAGAAVEEGVGMWFEEGYVPDALAPFEDPDDGLIAFEDLIRPGACAQAAITVTRTAACLTDIPAGRLTRLPVPVAT